MQKKSKREQQKNSSLNISAAWSGYREPYVQNIVKGALKALKLLATLTFDPGLFVWTKGLEHHLKKRIKEAEQEKKQIEKWTFS